jgi:hypothetical protein
MGRSRFIIYVILFLIYVSTLSVSYNVRMIINDELDWKRPCPILRYFRDICLGGIQKTQINFRMYMLLVKIWIQDRLDPSESAAYSLDRGAQP